MRLEELVLFLFIPPALFRKPSTEVQRLYLWEQSSWTSTLYIHPSLIELRIQRCRPGQPLSRL